MENNQEIWQVQVNGQIYEASLQELTEWIAERSLLPTDLVRSRRNVDWIRADQIPALRTYFKPEIKKTESAKTPFAPPPKSTQVAPNETAPISPKPPTDGSNQFVLNDFQTPRAVTKSEEPFAPTAGFQTNTVQRARVSSKIDLAFVGCHTHPEEAAVFECATCREKFCKACPKAYGAVRICPLCGNFCEKIVNPEKSKKEKEAVGKKFRFGSSSPAKNTSNFDIFSTALSYPLRFPLSFISIALVNALLATGIYLGSTAIVFGAWLTGMITVLFLGAISSALVYGCCAQVVNQVSQGNFEKSFVPASEDFSIWDNIIYPAALGLGAYLISLGPLLIAWFLLLNSVPADVPNAAQPAPAQSTQSVQRNKRQTIATADQPRLQIAESSGLDEARIEKVVFWQNSNLPQLPVEAQGKPAVDRGYSNQISALSAPFLLLLLLTCVWAVFYFPIALTVAGYSQSFLATINPLVGFDMLRKMGGKFWKTFLMYLVALLAVGCLNFVISLITSPLAAAGLGQIPGLFLDNLVWFYFCLVVACLFGYALSQTQSQLDSKF